MHTRLHVRARLACSDDEREHLSWIAPVHHFMESAQLRHLRARVEGRLPRSDWRDVAEGIGGAAMMAVTLLAPFLRSERSHWGIDRATESRAYPGDELVPSPRWSWTHGIAINASAREVWPWIAQIGADRAGFYSYQWLENVVGCEVRSTEIVHPEWEAHEGETLSLHPNAPPLHIVNVNREHWLVAFAPGDEAARAAERRWAAASWAFVVEPLSEYTCRVISRYRCVCSHDLATRIQYGSTLLEPIGFVMDRRMLLGVKERAERQHRETHSKRNVHGTPNAVWNVMDSTDATTFRVLLSHDHVRLDAMLDAILEVVHGAEQPMLDARWAAYEEQLLAHLDAEETYLLPELAKHDAVLAERVRHDHDTLRRALTAIGIGLDLHVVRDDQMNELARRLRAHAEMEEEALYPWADAAPPSLYRRLRAVWDRIGTSSTRPLGADDSSLRKGGVRIGHP